MMITISKENYLKAIAEAEAEGNTVISALLAHWLSVTPPAVTAALKRLNPGKSVTRFIVDNPPTAKTVFDSEQLTYVEAEIVQAKLPHRPGEIARLASRLGEANININYAYCGLEAGTNTPLVFFGVADASMAAPILEQAGAAAKP